MFASRSYTYEVSERRNWGNMILKNVFCYVELHSSQKSIGHSLNVLPLYCKKKSFVFSSSKEKKKEFWHFERTTTGCSSAGFSWPPIRSWFHKDGATPSMMSAQAEEPWRAVSPEAFTVPGFLCRTKQGCPGLNHYLCSSFPLQRQLCYFFAIPLVNGNDLPVEVHSI